jgi:hypothetical protein
MQGIAIGVSPRSGFRFVCYCKDCQAFARFLDRADVLDLAGGTDIFQMPPGHMRLTAGKDALGCLRLSNKVLRWYADCCRTPIANTATGPRFPIVAVIHSFMAGRALNGQRVSSHGLRFREGVRRRQIRGEATIANNAKRSCIHRRQFVCEVRPCCANADTLIDTSATMIASVTMTPARGRTFRSSAPRGSRSASDVQKRLNASG